MNDQQLEQAIAAQPHEKVTKESIEQRIKSVDYLVLPGTTVTICSITMLNGFSVRGESACVDPRNFNEEIGREIAYRNAFDKLWAFEGYLLAESRRRDIGVIDRIARVCHEVNRAYCQALGDMSQPAWEEAPEWQRVSARMGVDLHLSGDFGPEASHISWMKQKEAEGWTYGPVKIPEQKVHPCMVPFAELPISQQAKDYIFRAVVHALKK